MTLNFVVYIIFLLAAFFSSFMLGYSMHARKVLKRLKEKIVTRSKEMADSNQKIADPAVRIEKYHEINGRIQAVREFIDII